jgi:hypothetical protein
MAPPRGKYQIKLNAVMFSMMLEELMAGPSKAQDIAEYTGMSVLTVQRTLRVMHRRKVIHIAAWEEVHRGAVQGKAAGHEAPRGLCWGLTSTTRKEWQHEARRVGRLLRSPGPASRCP